MTDTEEKIARLEAKVEEYRALNKQLESQLANARARREHPKCVNCKATVGAALCSECALDLVSSE